MLRAFAILACLLLIPSAASAQEATRLRWVAGQTLIYRIEHAIQVSEVVGGEKSESKSRLSLTKRWQVMTVDADGVATVQLSLQRLRNEIQRPNGEVLLFDSADPSKTTPEIREQQTRYVGPVLAELRIDPQGRVVGVKDSKFGPASRFEAEPPFGALPTVALMSGSAWERAYQITLEPPQGTGEKYPALQRYRCTGIVGGLATVTLATELKTTPEAAADQAPLLQLLPAGELVYDTKAGRLHSASLKVDREVKGHQGEGSSYRFQSSYSEQYIGER